MLQPRRDALVGLCFLFAFPAFGFGTALQLTPLVFLNSVLVATIGAASFSEPRGASYFAGRIVEATLLLVSSTGTSYQLSMASLAVASIPFWWSANVPRWLRAFGVAGYAVLLVGTQLELAGLPYGLWLSIPGGLFELTIGFWFLARAWRGAFGCGSAIPA
ncbi:MAG: hypothetical protein ACO1OB_09015 [Archangium sp.]